MKVPLFWLGLKIWVAATIALRLAGQYLLRPSAWFVVVALFVVSFLATAWLVPRLCRRFGLRPDEWPAGAVSLLLPTLALDPFSSAFFPVIFPNMAPQLAGVFGGWMLVFCAGGLMGSALGKRA